MLHRVGVVLAPALILISPFLSLVTYDGYPMLAPEILLCGGAILVLGIAMGLLGRAWRPLAAAVLCGSLLLFIDIQFDPSYMALALAAVPLLGLCWALGDNLALVTAAGFAAVVASTLLLGGAWADAEPPAASSANAVPPSSDLPVFLHLILDEHAAPEGLPDEVDGSAALREQMKALYVGNGFRLYGQAYSRFSRTEMSIPHLLNDAPGFERNLVSSAKRDGFAFRMQRDHHLAQAKRSGYRLSVYQSDHLDFCRTTSGDVVPDRCSTFPATDIGSLRGTPLSTGAKARVIASVHLSRSRIYGGTRTVYNRVLVHALGLPLPSWDWERGQITPISAMAVLDRLEADLGRVRPGDFFLAHVLIPHFPYVYDADCKLRTDPGAWVRNEVPNGVDPTRANPSRVDPSTYASWQARYRGFIAQVACVNRRVHGLIEALRRSGQFERAIVLVHGDHGSRISQTSLGVHVRKNLTSDDLRDEYSTLFAVKAPGIVPGYDTDLWHIGDLLAGLRQGRGAAPILDPARLPPPVYLFAARGEKGYRQLEYAEIAMPRFAAAPKPERETAEGRPDGDRTPRNPDP